jgi:hypothetical protein
VFIKRVRGASVLEFRVQNTHVGVGSLSCLTWLLYYRICSSLYHDSLDLLAKEVSNPPAIRSGSIQACVWYS